MSIIDKQATRVYWIATLVLAAECLAGGVMGFLDLGPFRDQAVRLGYPDYFLTLLSACYVAAAVALLLPRSPRLKEWAYAGLVFLYTGAAASHFAVGDGALSFAGPTFFLLLTATSWALRPPDRRELSFSTTESSRAGAIVYWVATVSIAGELALGGVWDLFRIDYVSGVVEHLGYPAYLLTIMGLWKLPGAVALLIPRWRRVHEWVYAGAAINYGFAIASHVAVGEGAGAVAAPIALLVLTFTSWGLRRR